METSKNIYTVGSVLQITLKLPTSFSYVIESDEMKNSIKALLNSGKVRQKFSFFIAQWDMQKMKRENENADSNIGGKTEKKNCNSVMFFLWRIKYTLTWAEGVWCLIRVIIWGWLWHQTEIWIRNNDSCVQWHMKREPLWKGNEASFSSSGRKAWPVAVGEMTSKSVIYQMTNN